MGRTDAGDGRQASERVLGVFAHPDDEVFVAGGTFAKYAAAGAEVMIVSATRGQAGQIRDARVATRKTLGQVREQELRTACAMLGVRHVACLDYMDGQLAAADRDALVASVVDVMREFRPTIVITFGEDGAYGHPDHVAISAATTHAFELLYGSASADTAWRTRPRLYHSHFARSRMLMLDRLARWLVSLETRFRGGSEFVQSLSLFAEESTTLRYASDFMEVKWFPSGTYIIEQGEMGKSLYLIISGEVEVVDETPEGESRPIIRLGPGHFFGERALVTHGPRSAHVIAVDTVTCLVFSPSAPTLFAGRGPSAGASDEERADAWRAREASACIDVSQHLDQKIAAIAAQRSQFPIKPELFPRSMLEEMLGREYFVRMLPAPAMESEL